MLALTLDQVEKYSTEELAALIKLSCRVLERRLDFGALKDLQQTNPTVLDTLEVSYLGLSRVTDRLYAKSNNEEAHVDYFIGYGDGQSSMDVPEGEAYARWMLLHFTLNATLQILFKPFMDKHKLFCTYEGKRYRVTGASRLGDIWLSNTLEGEPAKRYDHRVSVSHCSQFGPSA